MSAARERAIEEQSRASDPAVSAFVEASAGSGKTKLLTDRMLRLMLGGAAPGRVQCLTFTKAAAAEMSLRLQRRLGDWVTMGDEALDGELAALEVTPGEGVRETARALFADVLDLPGGMRIGTIHAFCQSLLRRFPLEAAISPHFQLVEEVDAEAEMGAARDRVLEAADPAAVALVAGLARADEFRGLVQALQGQRGRLRGLLALPEAGREAAVRRAVGVAARSEAEVVAGAVAWGEEAGMREALRLAAAQGSSKVRERAMEMLAWLSFPPAERQAHWGDWLGQFFDRNGGERKFGLFPNANLDKQHPEIRDAMQTEQERVWFVEDTRRAVRCADATVALLGLAAPALAAYAEQKERSGLLDYSDLIGRAEGLLTDPGAAWVLYKLDGGIDHLLLDEVQDTAPEQWRIAHRLTEEFFAGLGSREGNAARTFFAVGDPKQSIYSFQGADPEEFVRSRGAMATRVGASGQEWRDVALDVSFRSTAPVLALVDAVFADPVAADGVAAPGALKHFADRGGAAGRVELWPLAPKPEAAPAEAWTVPAENVGLRSAPQMLAEAVAGAVARELKAGVLLESQGRALTAGDVLVLVRRRGPFASALVRALKAQDVAVAGLDRLALNEQIAVQDVLAACDAVLLPDDELAVANVLTSPLGGLSDDSLMRLAMGREHGLWRTLQSRAGEREDWGAAWAFLSRLAERADYVGPHALLAEALGPLGGRARLLARLGAEAGEPIDELLNAALRYARLHPPGLQGFVHWLRRSGAEVKREAGGAGPAVRVMTVHGAKGLQAPVVILPDTTQAPPERETLVWAGDSAGADGVDVPLWSPRKELRCAAVERGRGLAAELRRREHNRLLYVALTRAEDRLIVCGWQTQGAEREDRWYGMVRQGFERMGAETAPFAGAWGGEMLVNSSPQADRVPDRAATAAEGRQPLPPWAGRPGAWQASAPPEEPALPRPLAPSRPGGALFGSAPPALSPLVAGPGARFARGRAVHALLQHLPGVAESGRAGAARDYLARLGFAEAEREALAAQVLGVLGHPALSGLFGPGGRAEQPVSGLVGGQVVSGVVDRMAVAPDRVVVADFKTGRAAPADVADTPVRYVRQLAAYRGVLRALFPGRAIECALVWTEDAAVAVLPEALLDRHGPEAA